MLKDLSPFPITRKWPAQFPERIQLDSLPTPNGVKVSIMLEEIRLPYERHLVNFGGIADIATWPWVRNLYGFDGAGDLVGIDGFSNVKRAVDAFVARPAVAKGLEIPNRPAP